MKKDDIVYDCYNYLEYYDDSTYPKVMLARIHDASDCPAPSSCMHHRNLGYEAEKGELAQDPGEIMMIVRRKSNII